MKNGETKLDFMSLIPGGTADNANYLIGLTQYTCNNRQMPVNDAEYPVSANLTAAVIGTPQDLTNGFCCEVLISGTATYRPCGSCEPKTVFVAKQFCIPCASATPPTISVGKVVAQPEVLQNSNGCCKTTVPCTNCIALTTTINVTTAA